MNPLAHDTYRFDEHYFERQAVKLNNQWQIQYPGELQKEKVQFLYSKLFPGDTLSMEFPLNIANNNLAVGHFFKLFQEQLSYSAWFCDLIRRIKNCILRLFGQQTDLFFHVNCDFSHAHDGVRDALRTNFGDRFYKRMQRANWQIPVRVPFEYRTDRDPPHLHIEKSFVELNQAQKHPPSLFDEVNATLKRGSLVFSNEINEARELVAELFIPDVAHFRNQQTLPALIEKFPHVTHVGIENPTDEEIEQLQGWHGLKELIVCGFAVKLTGSALATLPKGLESLVIMRARNLTYESLRSLSELSHLKMLSLGDLGKDLKGQDEQNMKKADRFQKLPASLEEFRLMQTNNVNDGDFDSFTRLNNLRLLNISRDTMEGTHFASIPQSVRRLHCRDCRNLKEQSIRNLAHHSLKELDIGYIDALQKRSFKKDLPTLERIFKTQHCEV